MKQLRAVMQAQFNKMCATGKLFRSTISGQQIWDTYLQAFKEENDPIFRDPESSEHNCNLCKNFVRRYGNIVALDKNLNIMTIWDVDASDEYKDSVQAISELIKQSPIADVFVETFDTLNSLPYEVCRKLASQFNLGIAKNNKRYTKEEAKKFGIVKPNEIREFNHFMLTIPSNFINQSGKSAESIMGDYKSSYDVFKRAMEEIPLDTLLLVRDLIKQGSLLNAEAHLYKIETMIPLKREYNLLRDNKDNWCWKQSYSFPLAKFRNELIGVLCTELAEGEELNKACLNWNKRVDPANYMKAVAPITEFLKKQAQQFVEENGYEQSFIRRCATIDDIKASEILHLNAGDGALKKVSIFDNVKIPSTRHKRSEFDKVEEVSIEKFMSDILPTCTSVEAFLLNKHKGNLVTMTTAVEDSKPIFKWSNNYSWTYQGNLAGKSMIKEAVKNRGGVTEGDLNIRLHFPNTTNDYDLHILEPSGHEIYYGNRRQKSVNGGKLDLDAQGCDGRFPPEERVENVLYENKSNMRNGKYLVYVNNFSKRDKSYGFTIEVELSTGDVTTFVYDQQIPRGANVKVCHICVANREISVQPILPISESDTISATLYGLDTNKFHKVNLVCLSPNYWGDNATGNKHYLFMLDGCKPDTQIRSFHNENLCSELLPHRKVMDVLGAMTMIDPIDKGLSGLGFNATVRDEVVLRLQGSHKRIIKVKF